MSQGIKSSEQVLDIHGPVEIQSGLFKHLDKLIGYYQQRAKAEVGTPKEGEAIYMTMVRKTTIAQKMAHDFATKKEPVDESIPEEFRKFKKVFSEEESKRLPPDRNPNVGVDLLPDVPTHLNCKVYPLTKAEVDTLKKFLETERDKGFIEEAASSYTSPVFFIDKKDSKEKRLVIDYKKLNSWTVKDNGPLPRIDGILWQMEGKSLFSKFDIRWGYNNVPIKPEDRWKVAFKTPLGTYQPKVMYFGMQNAPSFWQRLMWRDFKPWLDKWNERQGTSRFVHMDDFGVASKDTEEARESHQQCIEELLGLMERHSYFLRPAKCEWIVKNRLEVFLI